MGWEGITYVPADLVKSHSFFRATLDGQDYHILVTESKLGIIFIGGRIRLKLSSS